MDKLLSVGLDVGTTTTQLIVSSLHLENKSSSFAVPEVRIAKRDILYRSPVIFTPLLSKDHVDGSAIAQWVLQQYTQAGICQAQVDTGAVIITGETSRKENAQQVLSALSGFAGDFVVATAGPDLESVLAAKGAGAVDYSAQTGKTVLHIDIGGGTSNLAYIEDGKILATGCLNVGGRLIKFGERGEVTYLSPVLSGKCDILLGQIPTDDQLSQITDMLVQVLETAAGLVPSNPLPEAFLTQETTGSWHCQKADILSFSGGVADCIQKDFPPFAFGDLGVLLGKAIRNSRLYQGPFRLGEETIRATVIGAGCHSTQLSGSTVFYEGVSLPKKNLPVEILPVPFTADTVAKAFSAAEADAVLLAIPGSTPFSYEQIRQMAQALVTGCQGRELLVCLETDAAKALGHAIHLLQPERPCLCIDRIFLESHSFLDIGMPVGPALPVVVKTLIFSKPDALQ